MPQINEMKKIAMRLLNVEDPVIIWVGDLIRQSPGTISLGQGVVGYGPPMEIKPHIERFFSDSQNHIYQDGRGIAELCTALKDKLARENGIPINRNHADSDLVVTAGSNMGFLNVILSIADPGDEVILFRPYFFNHEMAIKIAGCQPVIASTDDAFLPNIDHLRAMISRKTRAIVTVSPNNPTGAVYPESLLQEINQICAKQGIYHISDEAYEYFTYGGARHFSPGSIKDAEAHTISLFTFSKSHAFASWRIGYLAAPTAVIQSVLKVQDTNVICPPVISQFAALGLLEVGADYCQPFVNSLAEVRKQVLAELKSLDTSVKVPASDGAFYVFLKIFEAENSTHLVRDLIAKHKVALIPGSAFGSHDGCWVRLSYGALDVTSVIAGVGRLTRAIRSLKA